ncbi:MAG: TonB-dependent receptor [Rikenellaceae bacterium]|nr:TonB-dependent receptor [Rikenellaceae bacterium]
MIRRLFFPILFSLLSFAPYVSAGYDCRAANGFVIDRAAIDKSGAGDVVTVLSRFIPGVELSYNAAGQTVTIQGYGVGAGILVLVDGKRQSGTGDSFDMGRIPLAAVDKIEVTYGGSVLRGSDAVAMTVNIITVSDSRGIEAGARYTTPVPADMEWHGNSCNAAGRQRIEASLSAIFSRKRLTSQTFASFRDNAPYTLYGDPVTATPIYEGFGPVTFGSSMPAEGARNINISQRFSIKAHDKVTVELSGAAYKTDRQGVAPVDILPPGYGPDYGTSGRVGHYGGHADMSVEYVVNDRNDFMFDIYGSIDSRSVKNEGDIPKERNIIINPSVEWVNRPNDHHRITAGVDILSVSSYSHILRGGRSERHTYNILSVYGLEHYTCGDFSATGGLRIDNFGWDNFTNIYTNFIGKPKYMTRASVSPQTMVAYSPGSFVIKGAYELAYVMPSVRYRFIDARMAGLPIYGNGGLKRAKSHNVSLTASYSSSPIELSARLYGAFFKNPMILTREDDRLVYRSGHKNRYYGIEARVGANPLKGWRIDAACNLMRKHKKEVPLTGESGYRSLSLVASTDYTVSHKKVDYNIFLSASYLGSKEVLFFDPRASYCLYDLPSQVNLAANITVVVSKRYRFFIGADNLLDRKASHIAPHMTLSSGLAAHAGFALRFLTGRQ